MRRPPRIYPSHACPRCQSMTTAKDYCPSCLDVIRRPPPFRRSAITPNGWDYRHNGKGC